MSNLTCASGEASASSGNRTEIGTDYSQQYFAPPTTQTQPPLKKKRNLPGNPDPEAEVVALSPKTLLATNRFICEICNKGFQRDQNLQLHRRGHNLPWKLKQRTSKEIRKKVYVCPEVTCVHHDPSRALGDLTGIKKHFCRKHGEKKWKCDKCSKKYAVQSDWKAHSKTCGTREYRCDCGTLFSRRDSFITHRAFCDALAEESGRSVAGTGTGIGLGIGNSSETPEAAHAGMMISSASATHDEDIFHGLKEEQQSLMAPWVGAPSSSFFSPHENPNPRGGPTLPHMSATALLQKAAEMGATMSLTRTHQQQQQAHVCTNAALDLSSREDQMTPTLLHHVINSFSSPFQGTSFDHTFGGCAPKTTTAHAAGNNNSEALTRDFLGLTSLSHNDFLNIAAMGNCINNQTQNPWQG
ncbi:protein indeterminate-domain 11 [Cajanus cajan]|uniref:Zinc finger protein MAGPIE n=1 Tax=Cajanus cajan TaxID=3821 RepID=A0A151SUQ9_CAJCA|nr:protein indeterminate-domain 11 [Cajanus cajan]XP_020224294.1 protein indeterminate-domain 11 [Cajanus cajan]KYP58384.1 Zinc finger protein MAGPIE [Cajanus cajan]KYP58502.1 Zinc finger protein MAGPIE [Cajanus cajan]